MLSYVLDECDHVSRTLTLFEDSEDGRVVTHGLRGNDDCLSIHIDTGSLNMSKKWCFVFFVLITVYFFFSTKLEKTKQREFLWILST